jgi:calcineurin-like phosphoesterase family protein
VIIDNWNRTVSKDDLVFSLGDFTWEDTEFYLKQLNGNKILVRGNHDNQNNWYVDPRAGSNDVVIEYRGIPFFLTHDPNWIPKEWNGWAVHGHHHWMPGYPFIDGKRKNINVACEMIDFTPVDLDWILSMDIDTIQWMETVGSEPER